MLKETCCCPFCGSSVFLRNDDGIFGEVVFSSDGESKPPCDHLAYIDGFLTEHRSEDRIYDRPPDSKSFLYEVPFDIEMTDEIREVLTNLAWGGKDGSEPKEFRIEVLGFSKQEPEEEEADDKTVAEGNAIFVECASQFVRYLKVAAVA